MAYKILVVDDEPEILVVVEGRLKASGYEVVTASNGKEALAKVVESVPHLIILDVMMSEMDGFQVLEALRNLSLTAEIPVIMLTAKGESKHLLRAQELKATDYIIKPFSDEDLVNTIAKHI